MTVKTAVQPGLFDAAIEPDQVVIDRLQARVLAKWGFIANTQDIGALEMLLAEDEPELLTGRRVGRDGR